MSNLMQYIEENLLHFPEKCYGAENTSTDRDVNVEKLPEKPAARNVPLISPQSTLGDVPFRPPPGLSLPSVPVTLESILSETTLKRDMQTVPNIPDVPTLIPKKQNTNPFLEDDVTNNNYGSNLTPQQFVQLWTQNLQLQMQLSTTINTLLLKMMSNSTKNAGNGDIWKSFNQEEVLRTISNTLQTHLSSPNPGNTFDSKSQLFMNSTRSLFDNSVVTSNEVATNLIKSLTTKTSESLSPPNIFSELKNTSDLSNHNTTNYDFFNTGCANLDSSHSNTNSVQPNLLESTMGQDTLSNRLFTNDDRSPNKIFDFSTPTEGNSKIYNSDYHNSFNKVDEFNETNPFKLSLAGKLNITDSYDDVQNDKGLLTSGTSPRNNLSTTAVDHTSNDREYHEARINRTNYSANTDLYNNSFSTKVDENISNFFNPDLSSTKHSHNIDHHTEKIPAANQDIKEEHPSLPNDYGWSLDTINNRFSKIVIQAPPVMYNTNQETPKARKNKNYVDSRNFSERFHDKINGTQQDTLSSQYDECQRQIRELTPPGDYTLSQNPTAIGCELSSSIKSNIKQGNVENCKFGYENESPVINNNVQYGSSCFSSKLGSGVNSHVSYDYSKLVSTNPSNQFTMNSWSPLTGFTSPVFIDNLNADEGYITRPSTSHTSQSSSPPVQQTGATNTSVVNDPYNDMSKNLWNKPVTETFNYQNLATSKSDIEQQCDLGLQSSCSWNIVEREEPIINDFDDTKLRVLYVLSDPDSSRFRERIHGILTSMPVREKILYQRIALSKGVHHLFYYQGEGWILTDEFVGTFTDFKSSFSMRSWFSKHNGNMFLTEIEKSVYLPDLTEEDRASLKIPRRVETNIYKIQLMPLKSVLKVLKKLGVVTREDIDNAIVNEIFVYGSITHQVWKLINTYGQFIKSHESS